MIQLSARARDLKRVRPAVPLAILYLATTLVLGGRALSAGAAPRLEQVRADRSAALPDESVGVDAVVSVPDGGRLRWAVFLSTDAWVSLEDERLGRWHQATLQAGRERQLATLARLPDDLQPGSYTLGVIAELEGGARVVALDPIPLSVGDGANLRATLRNNSATARAGGDLSLRLELTNGGLRAAPPSTCRFFLSRNESITAWDHALGEAVVDGLAHDATWTRTLAFRVPGDLTPGTYYVGALLDSGRDVDETSEDDNAVRAAGRVVVSAGSDPNLIAAELELQQTRVQAGSTLRLRRQLRNDGEVASGAFHYAIVLSRNATISRYDPELWRGRIAQLSGGDSAEVTLDVEIPAGTEAGTYYVGMRVDPDDEVPEPNEGDNAIAAAARVEVVLDRSRAPAQLTATALRPVHRTVRPGQRLPFARTIRNAGAGDAAPFSYVVVLSRDERITLADRELYRFRFTGGLPAGESHERELQLDIPGDVRPGAYHLGVILDLEGEVLETNEEDNAALASAAVRVDRGLDVLRINPRRAYLSDGDTLRISGKSYRLLGYDTPEKRGPQFDGDQEPHASAASDQARAYLNAASELALHTGATDDYGRTLAHAFVDGVPLSKLMIEAEHAYETIRVFGDGGFPELGEELIEAQRGRRPAFQKPWLWRWSHSR